MASRFSLCSKLEGKQPRITRIYTNFFNFFAFRFAQCSKMTDNYRSGGGVEFFACFVMIFAINSKNPAKTLTLFSKPIPSFLIIRKFINIVSFFAFKSVRVLKVGVFNFIGIVLRDIKNSTPSELLFIVYTITRVSLGLISIQVLWTCKV